MVQSQPVLRVLDQHRLMESVSFSLLHPRVFSMYLWYTVTPRDPATVVCNYDEPVSGRGEKKTRSSGASKVAVLEAKIGGSRIIPHAQRVLKG